jgi:hypothetical protein
MASTAPAEDLAHASNIAPDLLSEKSFTDHVDFVGAGKHEEQVFHEHSVGNAFLVGEDGHIRNIPVPSSDPNDPLNFLKWQKFGIIFCCCWFCQLRTLIVTSTIC